MHAEETTVSHTLKRFHHFRYALVLEGVAVGILAGVVVVVFRILLEKAAALLSCIVPVKNRCALPVSRIYWRSSMSARFVNSSHPAVIGIYILR